VINKTHFQLVDLDGMAVASQFNLIKFKWKSIFKPLSKVTIFQPRDGILAKNKKKFGFINAINVFLQLGGFIGMQGGPRRFFSFAKANVN
jgi:hypothetical protein